MRKNSLKHKSIKRTIYFPEPNNNLRPFMSDFKNKAEIFDRPYPYTKNGFITKEGYFLQCDQNAHEYFAKLLNGSNARYLVDQCGWIKVWDYVSIFNKAKVKTPDFYLIYNTDIKLSDEQKSTVIQWCSAQKLTIKQAFGLLIAHYEKFMEE